MTVGLTASSILCPLLGVFAAIAGIFGLIEFCKSFKYDKSEEYH